MHETSTGGIGFAGALTIVFIVLKLAGVIGWSWWWVLAPLWITGLAVALFVVVAVVLAVIASRKGPPA